MFPYRLETAPAAPAVPPAAPPAREDPTPAPREGGRSGRPRWSRWRCSAATAAARFLQPAPVVATGSAAGQLVVGAAAQAPATTAAPAAPINVAGTVFAKINPAVVQIVVSGATRSPTVSGTS